MYNSNQNYKVNLLQTYIFRTYGGTEANNRKVSLLKRIIISITSAVTIKSIDLSWKREGEHNSSYQKFLTNSFIH